MRCKYCAWNVSANTNIFSFSEMTRSQANDNNAAASKGEGKKALLQAFVEAQQKQPNNLARCEEEQARRDVQRDLEQTQLQTQLLDLMQRQPQVGPQPQVAIALRQRGPNDLYDKFKKRGLLEFTSTMDHTHADEWMVRVEKIFKVFQCIGREQVRLAIFMFRNVAET